MNQWILSNISWILPLLVAGSGWVARAMFYRSETKAESTAREMVNKAHKRIDVIEDNTKELMTLRNEDTKRQDRFEQQVIEKLKELSDDLKELLKLRREEKS